MAHDSRHLLCRLAITADHLEMQRGRLCVVAYRGSGWCDGGRYQNYVVGRHVAPDIDAVWCRCHYMCSCWLRQAQHLVELLRRPLQRTRTYCCRTCGCWCFGRRVGKAGDLRDCPFRYRRHHLQSDLVQEFPKFHNQFAHYAELS